MDTSKKWPKISIITPSYNLDAYLEKAIHSLVSQGYPNLEYIIIDGGSTDDSIDIIKKYEKHLSYWVSEKDSGMYDALNKGFARASGEIMGWINSDDMLHQLSLFVLADIFSNNAKVNWLQGQTSVLDESGRFVHTRTPFTTQYDLYLKAYRQDKSYFIQQESTFWRRKLWEQAGNRISLDYRYAGDFELWMRYFRHAELYTTDALLGAFRVRQSGQASREHYAEYLEEAGKIVDTYWQLLDQETKEQLKVLKNYRNSISKIPLVRSWYIKKYPFLNLAKPKVKFDFKKQHFYLP